MAGMGGAARPPDEQRRSLNKRTIDPNDPRFVSVGSDPNPEYNCIAWALGLKNRWWEPHTQESIEQGRGYWPVGLPHDRSPETLCELFRREGFADCENGDLDPSIVKIALYQLSDAAGNQRWTHVARQLKTGLWTSKLGSSYEVTHRNPDDLDGSLYGEVYAYMAKPRRGDDP